MNLWKVTRIEKKTNKITGIQYWNADKDGKSLETAQSDLESEKHNNKQFIYTLERVTQWTNY